MEFNFESRLSDKENEIATAKADAEWISMSVELKNLVSLGLLRRTDRGEIPKRVEYKLNPLGKSLVPVISVMHKWGVKHLVRSSVLRKLGLMPEQAAEVAAALH